VDDISLLHVVVDLPTLFLIHICGARVFALPLGDQWVIVPTMPVHFVAVDGRVVDLAVLVHDRGLLLLALLNGIF
jgi:hypothetical protein